jgi:hypothetical protein
MTWFSKAAVRRAVLMHFCRKPDMKKSRIALSFIAFSEFLAATPALSVQPGEVTVSGTPGYPVEDIL